MRAARTAVLALLGTALLKGCLVVPYYSEAFPSRMNVEKALERRPGFPTPGVTTREEVLLRLGEPDLVTVGTATRWSYEWRKVVLVIPGCGSALEIPNRYTLTVDFDARGVVKSVGNSATGP